ncbi:hypothetical protein EV356DRAFT_527995 [Viridothelium virens]|uniref:Cell wall mannoprotein PIR1-like C-terminal domain-containing protein n=1 Tax=Viridothelium virens TaxID=1048519 RepID=A0A6A6HQ58_VIRVR|nr:hypothetical protein EV356DRAFT_527995 [Viridothelium virens]
MHYSLVLLTAVSAAVRANPLPAPQGVTASLAPSASAPAGCSNSQPSSFGIAVLNTTSGAGSVATETSDGQPAAPTATSAVSTISDGQPQAPTSHPVSQISDGQPQASTGQPVSQISDGQPQASTGVPVSQISDGQPQAPTAHPVSQISDGQPQAPTGKPVSQISDGQPQAPTGTPVTQISDGQPQAPTGWPVSQISDGQPQAPTGWPVSQISDGQPQAPTGWPISQISDGQPQAPTGSPVSQISDGQPQAPTSTAVSEISDGQPQATGISRRAAGSSPSGTGAMVACSSDDTLTMTLEGGILKDNKGRTGYIASNYQFQFDNPPQAGALYTAGFSVCSNGSLALGGNSTFYQCRSGNFFNLYNENWAPQCSPVTINVVQLQQC